MTEAVLYFVFLRPRYSIQNIDVAAGLTDLPRSGFDSDVESVLRELEP